jgi:hypothetical protein
LDEDVTDQNSGSGGPQEPTTEAVTERLGRPSALPLRELGELTRALLLTSTVEGVLQRVVVAARYVIPAVDMASITQRGDDGKLFTPVETDVDALKLDQLQYDSGQGPCIDAARAKGPAYAHSADLSGETAWPVFASGAVEHGYLSVSSTALLTNPRPSTFTGALNLYSRERDAFDASARDMAFVLATYASLALASAVKGVGRARSEAENLRTALETRTVIGQATGILMARRRLSGDEAFAVLSRTSQNYNVKLADLAQVLATHPDTADRL